MTGCLGSIEKGRVANLVLAQGEILDPDTLIATVFMDGKTYKPAAETTPRGRGQITEEAGGIR